MNYNSNAREFFVRSAIALLLILLPLRLLAATPTIIVLGDSLVAGYGLASGQAFPEKLAIALKNKGVDVEIINAGVSGDTTAGGLARIDWSVPPGTAGVILELGANDALRGLPPKAIAMNLEKMIANLNSKGIITLLAGMQSPPNMGSKYAEEFDAIYPTLAKKYNLLFYPFFLDGVAAQPELNQADGIHPTAKGVELMVEQFVPIALELVDALTSN